MLNNLSLKWKGLIIIVLASVGLLIQGYIAVNKTRDVILQEKQVKLKEIINMAYDNVAHMKSLADKGLISEEEAKLRARGVLRDVKYNAMDDYFFVFTPEGINVVHGGKPSLEGTNMMALKDPNGVEFIKEFVKTARAGGGFVKYHWERDGVLVPKLSYVEEFKPWNWTIGTGVYIDDVDAAYYAKAKSTAITILMILAVVAGFTFYVVRSIIQPVLATSEQMEKISNEEPVTITGTERKDEMGVMARTLDDLKGSIEKQRQLERELAEAEKKKQEDHKRTMNDVADRFQQQVGSVVEAVEKAATDMQGMAATLSAASEETTKQSSAVASAADLASGNVQTVAAAAEELSASIQELVKNVSDTAKATKVCTETAEMSQDYLKTLQSSVDEIDGVIQAINDVAEQTNLLALNATIEAARAGDAGKGFAVVANEVKTLAGETNKMTEEIAAKVADIKTSAADTITGVQNILKQIQAVDERTSSVSAAIEEQNSSTSEISRSAQEAAEGTGEVSNNIGQVQQAANDTATSTEQLKLASDGLAGEANSLRKAVENFMQEVRSA